jgi:hypothetical protein
MRELTVRKMCLEAMSKSGLKQMPDSWLASLTKMIAGDDATLKAKCRDRRVGRCRCPKQAPDELSQALLALAKQIGSQARGPASTPSRLCPPDAANSNPSCSACWLTNLGEDASVATRAAAVDALAKAKLSTSQQGELADAIAKVGPLELNRLLGIFENSTDEAVGTTAGGRV